MTTPPITPTAPSFARQPDGSAVFLDGSTRGRLTATLATSNLRIDPDVGEAQDAAVQAGRARADQAPEWTQLRQLAESAIQGAAALAERIDTAFRELKPDVFNGRKSAMLGEWAAQLQTSTEKVAGALDAIRARYAAPAIPFPVTSADVAALGVRLTMLDAASPAEAKALVADAIARNDLPFLNAAAVCLRSWREYRNAWKSDNDMEPSIGTAIVSLIENALWTPAADIAQYASDRADAAQTAWVSICSLALDAQRIDPTYRATGSFSPILDPLSLGV